MCVLFITPVQMLRQGAAKTGVCETCVKTDPYCLRDLDFGWSVGILEGCLNTCLIVSVYVYATYMM